MTWPSPTCSRISATVVSMKLPAVQFGRDAGDVEQEVAEHVASDRRVDHLGVELDAVQVADPVGQAGERRRVGLRRGPEAPGGRRIESPWLIQTGCSRSRPAKRPSDSVRLTVAGPYSRFVGRDDLAAELVRHQLHAVADAEDRQPARPQRRVGARRAVVVDRRRAARQDHRL